MRTTYVPLNEYPHQRHAAEGIREYRFNDVSAFLDEFHFICYSLSLFQCWLFVRDYGKRKEIPGFSILRKSASDIIR
jgi:hypothetical protein